MALSGMGFPIPEHPCLREIQGRALLPGRRNCDMKKRMLSLICVLALCLGLLPVTALAAAPDGQVIYVGNENVTSGGYWTTDSDGNVTASTAGETPTDNYIHYDAENNVLTLHDATIKNELEFNASIEGGTFISGSAIGVFNQSGNAELTISLVGTNTIANVGKGIFVLASSASTGSSNLTIQGDGSLNASASQTGIWVQSNGNNAALCVKNAEVTASVDGAVKNGVLVQAKDGSDVSLTVNGGSLTASVNANIWFQFGSGVSGSGTPTVTVSNNAIVRANGGIANTSSTSIQYGTGNGENGGIVFDGSAGTVYGSVTLQDDLEIKSGETLTVPDGSSLNCNGNLTNNGTILASGGTVTGSLSGSTAVTTPSITAQPTGQTVTEGSAAEFSVTATAGSETPTYQWQQSTDNGSNWTDISDATSANYTTGTTTTGMSGNQYRCVVTSASGVSVISSAATLTVETYTPPTTYTIRADVTPAGAGSVSGGGSYTEGTSVTLTATANPGYRFTSWTSVGGGTFANSSSANTTFTMPSGDVTITANFVQVYTVTVSSTAGGTATADKTTAAEGETVTLTATPDSGYHFDGWRVVSGTVTIQDNKFTMPAGNVEIQAIFDRNSSGGASDPTYSITLPSRVTGGELKLSRRYAEKGETVTLTAIPDEGYELDTLTVTDSKGKEIELTHKGGNEYTFKMPAGRVEIEVSFREIAVELPFTDVPEGVWYEDAAAYVYEHGLMAGTSATTFAPDATTSRSMIATILWRMAGSPVVNYAMDYTDVAQGQWYSEAIRWAASEGIVGGYGNGLFGTNDPITREQFAAMLYRFAQEQGYDVSIGENTNILSYTDVADLSEYAISAMQWAVGAGIINGTGDGSTLSPKGQATRAQAAAMLMRFCEEYVTW